MRFVQIFAIIIKISLIYIFISNLKSYENKCLQWWNKLYPICYSIKISIYVKQWIRIHCFLRDSQNTIANTYVVDTILQCMRNIKTFLSHSTKYLLSFKKLSLIKFSTFHRLENITDTYWCIWLTLCFLLESVRLLQIL